MYIKKPKWQQWTRTVWKFKFCKLFQENNKSREKLQLERQLQPA